MCRKLRCHRSHDIAVINSFFLYLPCLCGNLVIRRSDNCRVSVCTNFKPRTVFLTWYIRKCTGKAYLRIQLRIICRRTAVNQLLSLFKSVVDAKITYDTRNHISETCRAARSTLNAAVKPPLRIGIVTDKPLRVTNCLRQAHVGFIGCLHVHVLPRLIHPTLFLHCLPQLHPQLFQLRVCRVCPNIERVAFYLTDALPYIVNPDCHAV